MFDQVLLATGSSTRSCIYSWTGPSHEVTGHEEYLLNYFVWLLTPARNPKRMAAPWQKKCENRLYMGVRQTCWAKTRNTVFRWGAATKPLGNPTPTGGVTQQCDGLKNYTTNSPPYQVTEDDVSIPVESPTRRGPIRRRGGTIPVLCIRHIIGDHWMESPASSPVLAYTVTQKYLQHCRFHGLASGWVCPIETVRLFIVFV